METAIVEILLNGNVSNTTTRLVSAPEVAILRSIHGGDAVTNVTEVTRGSAGNSDEVERLRRVYGKIAFEKVYPGAMPSLPKTFADVGVEATADRPARRQKAD